MRSCRTLPGRWLPVFGAVFAIALTTPPAKAQGSGYGFLFREPTAQLTIRGGFAHATATSDIFQHTTEHLTLKRGDFIAPTGEIELSKRLASRFDVALGVGYSRRLARSEFREWTDQDDRPVEQTTDFVRLPLTATGKLYLAPRGRAVGRFAWIPARVAPYVGAGGGAMWYRFRQYGDFVDYQSLDIFSDELSSSGWTVAGQGLAGADVSLTPRVALTSELRYLWAKAGLSNDFEQFEPIDLSGVTATIGLSVRF